MLIDKNTVGFENIFLLEKGQPLGTIQWIDTDKKIFCRTSPNFEEKTFESTIFELTNSHVVVMKLWPL